MVNKIKAIVSNKKEKLETEKSCCGPTCCATNSTTDSAPVVKDQDQIKAVVKEKYGTIAKTKSSCCTADADFNVKESYNGKEGYFEEADLNLGCGLPTEYARISKGDTVLDLGSGAGNDVFVASTLTGAEGIVLGVDMTEDMVTLAQQNKVKLGLENVDFLLGEIENLPVNNDAIDVVISNCVMNLVPDKTKAFEEVYRVLKPGGHFSISDIILDGALPESIKEKAELYVGCVAGAMERTAYLKTIKAAGFQNIEVLKERVITFPEEFFNDYLTVNELKAFQASQCKVYSVTVFGKKE